MEINSNWFSRSGLLLSIDLSRVFVSETFFRWKTHRFNMKPQKSVAFFGGMNCGFVRNKTSFSQLDVPVGVHKVGVLVNCHLWIKMSFLWGSLFSPGLQNVYLKIPISPASGASSKTPPTFLGDGWYPCFNSSYGPLGPSWNGGRVMGPG